MAAARSQHNAAFEGWLLLQTKMKKSCSSYMVGHGEDLHTDSILPTSTTPLDMSRRRFSGSLHLPPLSWRLAQSEEPHTPERFGAMPSFIRLSQRMSDAHVVRPSTLQLPPHIAVTFADPERYRSNSTFSAATTFPGRSFHA
uniref:Uncharacterized protein n=1 Tax=Eptatretus burgeri TaxID=7764 RepID=A0A8C4N117_EPTBU